MSATSLWFGPPTAPLFGWIYVPDAGECGAQFELTHW
jgi:hypothetical protein